MLSLNWLTQVITVTWLNIRNMPSRPVSSIVSMIGIAGVVVVFVSVLSISEGFKAAHTTIGTDDTALVLRNGATSELSSGLSQDAVRIIEQAPGIQVNNNTPLASAELFVIVDIPKRSTNTAANVPLRGIQPAGLAVRKNLRIVEGRAFKPGLNEIIVGRGAARQFAGLTLGSEKRWGPNTWTVVGIFEDDGSVTESEIWCDVKVLQGAYNRGNSYQSSVSSCNRPAPSRPSRIT